MGERIRRMKSKDVESILHRHGFCLSLSKEAIASGAMLSVDFR